ncbi:MAG: insulinase family protein [Gemmatimonas sp.]|nr:insulinase family protein [Gemmatimonas sp.]
MRRTTLLVGLTVLATAGCSSLLERLPGSRPEPFPLIGDSAVRYGTFENGLSYFIRANDEPSNRAELRLVVNAGSILEDGDQRGLAHVVEHMAFNGTHSFERHEIVSYLESIGMRFGPDINAYTSFDETVYMLTLPTDSTGVLETGVRILEEWAFGITFDSVQVEQERQVVVEEWRLGQGAGSRLQRQQFPTLAGRSRYSERLPIGTIESLESFNHEALTRFYRDWYRPDLMAVVAVGDFDPDEMEWMIRERFASGPVPDDPRTRRSYDVPGHRETLISVATDPELTSSSISVYVKRRPRAWRDERAFRSWIVQSLASSMLVNRMSEMMQTVDSPFLDVSSFQGRFVRSLSTFALTVRTPENGVEDGLQALLRETERAARHGFTATELEREKREMLRAMEQRYAEREKTTSGSFAADYVSHYLYGGRVLDTETEYALYLRLIPEIERKETNAAARDWTRTANRVILVSSPEREGVAVPRNEVLTAIVQLAPRLSLRAYQDSISDALLVQQEPSEGQIVAEEEIPDIGVHRWELDNGATVYLKPTDFRDDEVLFAARSPGGTSLFSDEDYIPALTAAAVVQAGGLGALSGTDLRKRLAGRVAGVGADIGTLYEGLSGAASPQDLEILFQLAHLKFTAPRPDTAAFLAYRTQARAAMQNRSASPDIAFQDTIRVTLAQNHPRVRPPSVEMFDRLDMQRSFEIYRDRFADASDFTFYLVGSFELDEVRPMVRRYLASLPNLGRVEEGRDLGIRPPTGVVEKTVVRGIEPRARTEIIFTGPIEFDRSTILAVQSLADVLRMRLREVLREDLGGTYNVTVRGSAARDPSPRYQVAIGFAADPQRLDNLVDAVFAEIERLKDEGPIAEDVSSVREIQYRSRETDLRQNHFWLSQLMTYSQHGWDLSIFPSTPDRAASADVAGVQDAAVRYLNTTNYVRVSLLPALSVPQVRADGTELPR